MQSAKFKITIQNAKLLKIFLFFFFCLTFTFTLSITSVFAHVLKTDGTIGAVLHINPDDEPTANQQANFVFEFKDKTGTFQGNECDCVFSILTHGKTIYSQPLFQDNTTTDTYATISYTFPQSNIYHVEIHGKPLSGTRFTPFRLSWDIRVAAGENTQKNTQSNALYVSPSLVLFTIFLLGGIILFVRNRSKQNT